ncbi:replication protein [Paenibacillus pini]|uniref:replication protein n=1 Tax=Paenibacillus pini TaxID=669461 RepID=UPI001F578D21|nr:replication protein [Paenibacillus pini]
MKKETFTKATWYFYYDIGKEMYNSGIRLFEDTAVYSFLVSRPDEFGKESLIETYNKYKGYQTIHELMEESSIENANDDFHFSEIQKYESLRNMQKDNLLNIHSKEFIKKLADMSLQQLHTYCQHKFKTAFSHVNSGEVVIYNLTEDMIQMVEELDLGEEVGLPLYESPRLTKKINGQKLGNLMYLVLSSGVGKSSIVTEKFVLSIFDHNVKALNPDSGLSFEKAMIFVNEEGKKRWQARLLATVASRILHKPIPRDVVNKGKFSKETKATLLEAAKWLTQNQPDFIKLVVLKKYRIEDVISNIELHRPLGYKHIYFDTFKPDLSKQNVDRWLAFSNSAQDLHDCIKEENYNCAALATVQMKIGKEFRYIDLDSIGKSPEIVEVAAVVMAGRLIFADEYQGMKKALFCYNWEKNDFDGKWHKKEYELDPEKKYLILFLPKNREGSEDEQIVFEVISDLNIWKEVAFVQVPNNGSDKK